MPRNRPSNTRRVLSSLVPPHVLPSLQLRPTELDRFGEGGWGSKRRGDRRWRGSVCRATGRSVVPCSVRVTFRSRGLECKRYIKQLRFFARAKQKRLVSPRRRNFSSSLALLMECLSGRHSSASITSYHIHH